VAISFRMRLALASKGALLVCLAALFVGLAGAGALTGDHALLVRAAAVLVCLPLGAFLGWNGGLGLADALVGHAREVAGAVALASRRSGYSLQLPDGRFAEFVLFNPWEPLVPGRHYTVVMGRWSRVVVSPPRPQ
jgi:hypothetical protein